MPKFTVRLVREATQYTTAEVEAKDEEAAEEAAQDMLDNGHLFDWDLSDDTGPPYILDGETEQEKSEDEDEDETESE